MRNACALFLFSLLIAAAGCGVALAQDADLSRQGIAEADVTVPAGTTPESALHIFDRLGDWARFNFLTFNAIRKAEVRAEIAEERLAELKAVVEKGADAAVAARAEALYRAEQADAQTRLNELDSRGQNVADLAERFNQISLRHQAVLGRVLLNAPVEAKEAIKQSLDRSQRGLTQATEVVAHQLERGNLDAERAKKIVGQTTDDLRKKIEIAERDLAALKARTGTVSEEQKELLAARIRGIENLLAMLESRPEFKDIRNDIRLNISNAAQRALEARQAQDIRDIASEDSLRAIQNQQFDPEMRARRMIAAATELLAQLERKINEAMDAKKEVPEKVTALSQNANDHLAKARSAFDAKDFGEAFGQANSAIQNAKNALAYFDSLARLPADANGRICAQVVTPARNAATKDCKVFPNACLPDGWVPDRACAVNGIPTSIQNISPQGIPAPAGVAPTIPRTWEVKITDEGFFPKELAIKQGDAVIWMNGGSRPHWPASAMHPTHAVYPTTGGCLGSTFDACRGLETAERFEFKFEHIGTWRYHDHLNTSLTGAIIVENR
ncbi:MAG: hypothetical protein HYT22_03725 [Candidatus Niyogibacteria bacterium]|nr:hypothetical protein [Candidatus Niyogibacteria bacterium]